MGFFGNIGSFFKKSFKSLSNPVKYLGDLGSALMPKNWFSDFDGDAGLFGSGFGDFQDFWDDYTGRGIAEKNLKLQKAQFDYQKQLNDLQMMREDTAYQRKVNDITSAGFNPILATGGSGSPSTALHAGPAPQMADTSGALRESVGQAFGILQGIAGLKKVNAETSLLKSQKDYQDIVNSHEDEYLAGRNLAQNLSNDLASGVLNYKIKDFAQKVEANDKKLILLDLEKNWRELDIDSKKLDNAYKTLENFYFEQESDRKLCAMSIAILRDWSEYEAFQFKRDFYEKDFNVPVGFDPSNSYLASVFIGRNGDKVLNYLKQFASYLGVDKMFSGLFGGEKAVNAYTPYAGKRPDVSGFYNKFRGRMHDKGDYGARRNAFSSWHWYD